MANINTAQSLLIKARAARAEGLYTEAVNMALAAQRNAKQCRAAARGELAWNAHNVVASCKIKAASHTDRSNTGRALAESQAIGWDF